MEKLLRDGSSRTTTEKMLTWPLISPDVYYPSRTQLHLPKIPIAHIYRYLKAMMSRGGGNKIICVKAAPGEDSYIHYVITELLLRSVHYADSRAYKEKKNESK